MRCPDCGGKLNEQWGDTGPVPSVHILVRKCPKCGDLKSDWRLIDEAIRLNRKELEHNLSVHHEWPDSLELVAHSVGLALTAPTQDDIVRALLRHGLY